MFIKAKETYLYVVYFILLFCLIFLFGGLLVLLFSDRFASQATNLSSIILTCACFFIILPFAVVLFKRAAKKFVFNNILFLLILICTLFLAETVTSFFVPNWPNIGLHGVRPETGIQGWGRTIDLHGGFDFNSWGQRDNERTIKPKKGIRRVVFVGDSLLEESTIKPFPILTEDKIGSGNIEVINLGVSVSDPEDYYYRIKNIALPLKPKDCFLFFYLGNDFKDNVKAISFSFLGIAAVYPRDSLFEKLNLRSLNHVITNRYRPVLLEWGKSGELHKKEQHYGRLFLKANDSRIKDILISMTRPHLREFLNKKLDQHDMGKFYAMLRNPDKMLFRTYYLTFALNNISANSENDIPVPDCMPAYEWIKRCRAVCNKRNINFTLVFIPDAFNVDVRMQELWDPPVDMKALRSPLKKACERLKSICRWDGIDYIDLSDALDGKSGTYLNPDGHLSEKGADIISDIMKSYIIKNDK